MLVGIPLLLLTFAVLYLGSKLLSFAKALQAIRYANNLMVSNSFYIVQYPQASPWETYSLIIVPFKCNSTENVGGHSWTESFIPRKT